jgi:hypothetical protein
LLVREKRTTTKNKAIDATKQKVFTGSDRRNRSFTFRFIFAPQISTLILNILGARHIAKSPIRNSSVTIWNRAVVFFNS